MVKYRSSALDATFRALADPTRRAMLARLAARDASVSELARPFAISLPGVHKHLAVLERAGLVTHAKHGRVRRCRLVARPMKNAARWIERYRRFWETQFDALAAYLAQPDQEETPAWPLESGSAAPPPPLLPSPSGSNARSPRRPSASSGRGRRRRR
ncbi:MAG TPA: metalloregulator ArsR/SmtB family transcription factor [Gemmatimonadales bacterium]|nr:metalloregulator ArsR/SmtB family transcription factor [Gemmatimonadales bacterium]